MPAGTVLKLGFPDDHWRLTAETEIVAAIMIFEPAYLIVITTLLGERALVSYLFSSST